MGVVYEAQDPDLERTVALKTIQLAFGVTPQDRAAFEARFFEEARIAAKLSHPGIVSVHDAGRDGETGSLYIALEYLPGKTLGDVLKGAARMDWRHALRVTRRIAEALHHAHSHGVVHRDVKPSNIMLLPSGEPKIMDFGIAKADTARIKLTATGQFFGTPLFMAPEQALARPVDGRADLFALGAIVYLLLTGRQAFYGENVTRIITRVVHEDPPPPSAFVAGLPPDVDYLVARALAKEPGDRYPDGQTLAEDAEDVLGLRPARHRREWTPPPRAPSPPTLVPAPPTLEVELEDLLPRPSATRSVPEVDVEAELATLVAAPPTRGPAVESAARGPVPASPRAATARPARRPSPPPSPRGRWLAAAVALLGLAVLGAFALRSRSPQVPAGVTASASASERAEASRPRNPPPPVETARLAVDFQHPLREGVLRVWVDDALVLEQDLQGHVTRKIVGIKLRRGSLQQVLDVPPGRRRVRVQVSWDESRRTETLAGSFEAGRTHQLRLRMSRLRKDLVAEWL